MEGATEANQDVRELQGESPSKIRQQEHTDTADESAPADEAAGVRSSSPYSDLAREDGSSIEEGEKEQHEPAPVDATEDTQKQCQEVLASPMNKGETEEEEREGEGGGEQERDADHHVTMVPNPQEEGDREEEEDDDEEEGKSGEGAEGAMEENEEVEAEAGEPAVKEKELQVVEGSGSLPAASSSSAQERRAERMRRLRELHMRRVSM